MMREAFREVYMRKHTWTRVLSLVLVFVFCLSAVPQVQTEAEAVSNMNSILNATTVYPQRTGYKSLDKLVSNVLAPYANKSTAEKVQACYDWCVRQINYSWAGYRAQNSGYNGFNQAKHPYPYNDYETGLQQAFPAETINRVYYTMANHKGVCYDYAAVFTVMMRAIGLEAYTRTGMYKFESWASSTGGRGHHGWSVVSIGGTEYIFDPQREYRRCNDGRGTVSHSAFYGLRPGDTYYSHYYLNSEPSTNQNRDKSFLSVTAHRQQLVSVAATSSASGSVSGAGTYDVGTNVTLNASSGSAQFQGWYDDSGRLLSTSPSYSFTVTGATTVHALFAGDYFYDIPADAWYRDDAVQAGQANIISGTAPYRFSGSTTISRAMIVKMLANYEGIDQNAYANSKFTDVANGTWYTGAVAWAEQNGIVMGVSSTKFAPNQNVTREDYMTILARYMQWKKIQVTSAELPYSDASSIDSWAVDAMKIAQGCGLLKGFTDGTCKPRMEMSRAEGVAFLMRMADYITRAPKLEDKLADEEDEQLTDEAGQETPADADESGKPATADEADETKPAADDTTAQTTQPEEQGSVQPTEPDEPTEDEAEQTVPSAQDAAATQQTPTEQLLPAA